MLLRVFLAVLLAAAPCWPQEISQSSVQASAAQSSASQSPVPPEGLDSAAAQPQTPSPQTITVPAGTRIPLTLGGQITSKSRAGDPVRAMTAFPVTVDTQVAIPVGTYVEGVIDSVNRRTPSAQIHFTRIVFANGYTLSFAAQSVQAKLISHDEPALAQTAVAAPRFTSPALTSATIASPPANADLSRGQQSPSINGTSAPSDEARLATAAYSQPQLTNSEFRQIPPAGPSVMLASYTVASHAAEASPVFASYSAPDPLPQQQPQQPQLPPLPNNSHVGLAVAIGAAFTAAFVVMLVLLGRHRGPVNGVVFDNGWQFQMVLQTPLTLDLSKISSTNSEAAATS